jgi:hypothetical protein
MVAGHEGREHPGGVTIGPRVRVAAKLGTSSPISPGGSCPSGCANGPTGSDQGDLVLHQWSFAKDT